MNTDILWEDLARYFSGELTDEKKEKMESWVKADPEREKKIETLYMVWKESGSLSYRLDVEKAWNTLSRNMDNLEWDRQSVDRGYTGTGTPHRRGRRYIRHQRYNERRPVGTMMRQMTLVAVAATVLLTAGLFTFYNHSTESTETTLGSRELVARNGERVNFKLNDGSRIILHAGSRLEIPLQFNDEERELFLEGEAYFEVARNAAKPFTVHSKNAEIRVLGTSFLVQAWPETRDQVEVIVAEGKVAFGSGRTSDAGDRQEVILTRNQKGILANGEVAVVENADMDWYMGWTRGNLFFNDRRLSEIIPKLERWYAIEIKTGDEGIGVNTLTAEIDYSQPMSEVLGGIAMVLDLDLEKKGRTFIFKAKSGGSE